MNQRLPIDRQTTVDELVDLLETRFFKALSEPVRVGLLRHLLLNGRCDIATISETFPQDRSVISRHLQVMLAAGMLKSEKTGRRVFYEIDGQTVLGTLERIVEKIRRCLPYCC